MMRFIDEFTPHELEMLELKGMTAGGNFVQGNDDWNDLAEHENDLRQESLQAEADEASQGN